MFLALLHVVFSVSCSKEDDDIRNKGFKASA
jgi:hypothetical protein